MEKRNHSQAVSLPLPTHAPPSLYNTYHSNPKKYLTDKDTIHSYLSVYDKLFGHRKYESLTILEIGILWGGSLLLWAAYFPNAEIVGVDIRKLRDINHPRIHPIYQDVKQVDDFIFNHFDIIIDDGSHKIQDQLFSVRKFYRMLKNDGLLIIEDVKGKHKPVFEKLHPLQIIDCRNIKSRYDDILVVFKR